ncbi:hypothetical protein CAPN004_10520 [Capnocytophaga cynodegmi]|uniref:hypothetical protein n=1 Tax=Capnocytophaga cynodegmi TaxID=28189 RepID=UPI001AC256FF|nr:hypothetical protein [Capnocytophaga cynodegmi]GIM52022.1 hypothetical protein CAPN004_10520 [Capnocytophaga cynodegmi]
MRKAIIKFFALDYKIFIFGRVVSFTRSANVIFPLVVFNGLLAVKENVPLELSLFAFILLALAMFFGFIYFDIKPLKDSDYDYFDEVQKSIWDYKEKGIVRPTKCNGTWVFWVNPLSIVIFLILHYLI